MNSQQQANVITLALPTLAIDSAEFTRMLEAAAEKGAEMALARTTKTTAPIDTAKPMQGTKSELWAAKDIAQYLGLSASHVYSVLVSSPDFPAPIQASVGKTAKKRWFAQDVIAWLKNHRRQTQRIQSKRRAISDAVAL